MKLFSKAKLCALFACSLILVQSSIIEKTHAEDAGGTSYEFNSGQNCVVRKYVNKKWDIVDASEIAKQAFPLKPSPKSPNLALFISNGIWYSTPKECMSPSGSPANANHSGEESHGDESSEFLHQANAKVFEITPLLNYPSRSISYKSTYILSSSKTAGILIGSIAEYGLNANYSLGLVLQYTSLTNSLTPLAATTVAPSTKTTGLKDPILFFNGKAKIRNGLLRYGLSINLGVSHSQVDSLGNANAASGGSAFTPMVGYEFKLASGLLGAQLMFDAYKGNRTTDTIVTAGSPISTSVRKGGGLISLAGFYEYTLKKSWVLGAALQIMSTSQTTDATVNGVLPANQDSGTNMGINLYASYEMSPKLTLLPQFSYTKFGSAEGVPSTSFSSSSAIALNFGVRYKL